MISCSRSLISLSLSLPLFLPIAIDDMGAAAMFCSLLCTCIYTKQRTWTNLLLLLPFFLTLCVWYILISLGYNKCLCVQWYFIIWLLPCLHVWHPSLSFNLHPPARRLYSRNRPPSHPLDPSYCPPSLPTAAPTTLVHHRLAPLPPLTPKTTHKTATTTTAVAAAEAMPPQWPTKCARWSLKSCLHCVCWVLLATIQSCRWFQKSRASNIGLNGWCRACMSLAVSHIKTRRRSWVDCQRWLKSNRSCWCLIAWQPPWACSTTLCRRPTPLRNEADSVASWRDEALRSWWSAWITRRRFCQTRCRNRLPCTCCEKRWTQTRWEHWRAPSGRAFYSCKSCTLA